MGCPLMDEPFAALDAQTRDLLQEQIKRIWLETRKTVLWITHSIDAHRPLERGLRISSGGEHRHASRL